MSKVDIEPFLFYLKQLGLSDRTLKQHLRQATDLLSITRTLDEYEVKNYLFNTKNHLKKASINKYISTLQHLLEFYKIKWERPLKRFKEEIDAKPTLSDEEIEKIIHFKPLPNKFSIYFMTVCYTGARVGEIAKLRVSDIDLAQSAVLINKTKTGVGRVVPLIEPLKSELVKFVAKSAGVYLFPCRYKDEPTSQAVIYTEWKKRLKALGIKKKVPPYSLRHSFITQSLGNGATLFEIQNMVGHKKADTTKRYYHSNIDLMRKAAQKLPLAKKHTNPEVLVEQMEKLIDDYLGQDERFDREELLEAKKHLYRAIKKP